MQSTSELLLSCVGENILWGTFSTEYSSLQTCEMLESGDWSFNQPTIVSNDAKVSRFSMLLQYSNVIVLLYYRRCCVLTSVALRSTCTEWCWHRRPWLSAFDCRSCSVFLLRFILTYHSLDWIILYLIAIVWRTCFASTLQCTELFDVLFSG